MYRLSCYRDVLKAPEMLTDAAWRRLLPGFPTVSTFCAMAEGFCVLCSMFVNNHLNCTYVNYRTLANSNSTGSMSLVGRTV